MKIEIEKDELIVHIPLHQTRNNPYDDEESKELTSNLLGVIENRYDNKEYTINYLNDLSYKGDQQAGSSILHLDKDEWERVVKELHLSTMEYPQCVKCRETIYGSHSWNDGEVCSECES